MKPTEPTMNVLKISPSEKKFLLSQIADVLSKCQSLVSMLSTAQCQEEESILNVKDLCQKITAPSLNLMSKDVLHTLAYDCDVSSTSDEEDVSSVTSQSSLLSCWDITEDYPLFSQFQILRLKSSNLSHKNVLLSTK